MGGAAPYPAYHPDENGTAGDGTTRPTAAWSVLRTATMEISFSLRQGGAGPKERAVARSLVLSDQQHCASVTSRLVNRTKTTVFF